MKKLMTKPIRCRVLLAASLCSFALAALLLIVCMVKYDGLSGVTRSAVIELAEKGKTDPTEVVRRLQDASFRLQRGADTSFVVGKMLDINRGSSR